jgi:hypothetical protein
MGSSNGLKLMPITGRTTVGDRLRELAQEQWERDMSADHPDRAFADRRRKILEALADAEDRDHGRT